jgi:acetylornithine deacetylase/succinyl-diaminopimelate desuccinylase-like protein
MAKLSSFLRKLETRRTPVHITPIPRLMIETLAKEIRFPAGFLLRLLLRPTLTDPILGMLGSMARNLEPLFRNTVNATIVGGGEKINVIPSEVDVQLDGRLLPGFAPEDLSRELQTLLGERQRFEVLSHDPVTGEPDMGLFDMLAGILREADPEAIPVPMLLPAVTDGRLFSRLNIQTYGFTPMKLPRGFSFFDTIHAADERIPVAAVEFGAEAIYRAIERYRI